MRNQFDGWGKKIQLSHKSRLSTRLGTSHRTRNKIRIHSPLAPLLLVPRFRKETFASSSLELDTTELPLICNLWGEGGVSGVEFQGGLFVNDVMIRLTAT